MKHADWLPYAILLAVAACALGFALRTVSRQWAGRWSALRAQPRWLRWLAGAALVWIGIRLARAGWRPLLAWVALVAVCALWGELAVRARRSGKS
jgi:hypothetical protein